MEKVTNAVLFSLACVAGVCLFAAGIHRIKQRVHARHVSVFLLYLSVVLLGLGAIVGTGRLGSPPACAQDQLEKDAQSRLAKNADWAFIQTYRQRCRTASSEQLPVLEQSLAEAAKKLDSLHNSALISRELKTYLGDALKESLESARLRATNRKPVPEVAAKCSVKSIQAQNRILTELTRDTTKNDSSLATMLMEDAKEAFQAMRGIGIAQRLTAGNFKNEEYKETVCQLMDNLFIYSRRCQPGAGTVEPIGPPQAQEEYAVRRRLAPVQPAGAQPQPVSAVEGKFGFKEVGKNWAALQKGTGLFNTTVIENQGNDVGVMTFGNGMTARIAAHEILTGWEVDAGFTLTPDQEKKTDGFIKQLGNDDWQVREGATEELRKIGLPARHRLEEAGKTTTDPEVRFRAETLLQEFAQKFPAAVNPIADNLVVQASPPQDQDPGGAIVLYAIRER